MPVSRILALDALRGIAILAMIVYHLSWDLSWFGHVDWAVNRDPGWRVFAGCIAGTFLFIAGLSLTLAHGTGIRWRAFLKRELILVAAAAGVSLVTYFTFGDTYVRFGILHALAASSLVGIVLTPLPAIVSLAATALIGTAPLWAGSPAFDGQLWLWTGLGQPVYGAVDYVPLAPWAGLTCLGVATGKALDQTDLLDRVGRLDLGGRAGRMLVFLGRHSLVIYLVHQPLLYGLVWSVSELGLTPDRSVTIFTRDCTRSCAATFGDEDVCRASCSCTAEELQAQGIWSDLIASPADPDLRLRLNETYSQCLREAPGPGSTGN